MVLRFDLSFRFLVAPRCWRSFVVLAIWVCALPTDGNFTGDAGQQHYFILGGGRRSPGCGAFKQQRQLKIAREAGVKRLQKTPT